MTLLKSKFCSEVFIYSSKPTSDDKIFTNKMHLCQTTALCCHLYLITSHMTGEECFPSLKTRFLCYEMICEKNRNMKKYKNSGQFHLLTLMFKVTLCLPKGRLHAFFMSPWTA